MGPEDLNLGLGINPPTGPPAKAGGGGGPEVTPAPAGEGGCPLQTSGCFPALKSDVFFCTRWHGGQGRVTKGTRGGKD